MVSAALIVQLVRLALPTKLLKPLMATPLATRLVMGPLNARLPLKLIAAPLLVRKFPLRLPPLLNRIVPLCASTVPVPVLVKATLMVVVPVVGYLRNNPALVKYQYN